MDDLIWLAGLAALYLTVRALVLAYAAQSRKEAR